MNRINEPICCCRIICVSYYTNLGQHGHLVLRASRKWISIFKYTLPNIVHISRHFFNRFFNVIPPSNIDSLIKITSIIDVIFLGWSKADESWYFWDMNCFLVHKIEILQITLTYFQWRNKCMIFPQASVYWVSLK